MKVKCTSGMPGFFVEGKEYPAFRGRDGALFIFYGKGQFDCACADNGFSFAWIDTDGDDGVAAFEVVS